MRKPRAVVYLALDEFWPVAGKPVPGLEAFLEKLESRGVPAVWVTGRSRLQIDAPRRKLSHFHPFIAESGCGVYLPEDYFHLRVERSLRLGRFLCLPIAEPQPAASAALDALSEAAGIPVVRLRALSPRELLQNTGLTAREAELFRQRDFEELFFFAGADEGSIRRVRAEAERRRLVLREIPPLWTLSAGADLARAMRQLGSLYDRALHAHAITVGIGAPESGESFLRACDRAFMPARRNSERCMSADSATPIPPRSLHSAEDWNTVLRWLIPRE